MGESTPGGRGLIAERLDALIRAGHAAGGGPRSEREIARISREHAKAHPGAPTVSHQTVANIRDGVVRNPGVDSLRALANVFGVKLGYFLEEEAPAAQQPEEGTEPPPLPTSAALNLAARLNRLFETIHPKGRGAYSSREVAETLAERGKKITESQVEHLRNGMWDSTSYEHLEALASFFGVPIAYFSNEGVAAQVSVDLDLVDALKAQGVGPRQIALRAVADLDDEALEALVPVIEHLRQASNRQRM
jgi:transcriptional regulator with XRE-family HTH domain